MQLAARTPTTRTAAAQQQQRRRASTSMLRCTTTCRAHQQQRQQQPSSSPPGLLLSSLAASAVLLLGAPAPFTPHAAAAPVPEEESFGASRTRALIEQQGTPDAARPDTMRTNVPFQAPGINAPPRGQAQEQGTTAGRVVKNAAQGIKANNGAKVVVCVWGGGC